MKRVIFVLLALVLLPEWCYAANCQSISLPKNTANVIPFCLSAYNSAETDDNEKLSLKTDATFAAGDVVISLDNGGENPIGTLPTDRGLCYDVPVASTEVNGNIGYIVIKDQDATQTWIPHCIVFVTHGPGSFHGQADVNVASMDDDVITGAKVAPGALAKGDQITGFNDVSTAQVNAEADTALGDFVATFGALVATELSTYDAPTQAEMTSSFAALNDLSAAEVNAQVDASIEEYHLDHLFAADYDPASKPGVATALLNEIFENDGGVSRLTGNSLENAPSGSGVADWSATEKENIRSALGVDGTKTAASGGQLQTLNSTVTGLNDLSAAEVNAQVDASIEEYHLDHLFAADYDPASKPGVATALLNEIFENDGGVSRLTGNSLENAPSGSGVADWSATEKENIRSALGVDGTKTVASGGQLQALDAVADAILVDTGSDGVQIADDGLESTDISSGAGAKIADIVLRRNSANVEASSDGDTLSGKSLYGVLGNQTHKTLIENGQFKVYNSDGSSVVSSRPVTSSPGAAPITGLGN